MGGRRRQLRSSVSSFFIPPSRLENLCRKWALLPLEEQEVRVRRKGEATRDENVLFPTRTGRDATLRASLIPIQEKNRGYCTVASSKFWTKFQRLLIKWLKHLKAISYYPIPPVACFPLPVLRLHRPMDHIPLLQLKDITTVPGNNTCRH